MSSNNAIKILSYTINRGENSTRNSETTVAIAIENNNKKIRRVWKIRGPGQRSKELSNNICNSIYHLRGCPPGKIRQTNKSNYHIRKMRFIPENNLEDSTSWKANGLTCIVCKIPVTSKSNFFKILKVRNTCTKFAIALKNTVLRVGLYYIFLDCSFFF